MSPTQTSHDCQRRYYQPIKKLFTVSVYAHGLPGPFRVKFDHMVNHQRWPRAARTDHIGREYSAFKGLIYLARSAVSIKKFSWISVSFIFKTKGSRCPAKFFTNSKYILKLVYSISKSNKWKLKISKLISLLL